MAERFRINDNKSIFLQDTDGLFQIIGNEQVIVIDDSNNPNILYIVSLRYGNMISFEIDILPPPDSDGITYANCQWGVSILLDERDVLLLDLDSEIIITRNYDVFRIPFRYLLLSRSDDDFCRDLEYLGSYKPTTAAQEQIVIRGKTYNFNG